jgi:Rrf2 family protein
MLELALQYGNGPIYLKDIAASQGISEKYLWQLLNPLKLTGLVHATRGANGGYALAKAPAEITLQDILRCLEGSLCLVDCVENPSLCERSPTCVFHDLWREVAQGMARTLKGTTLAAMVERQKGVAHAQAGR